MRRRPVLRGATRRTLAAILATLPGNKRAGLRALRRAERWLSGMSRFVRFSFFVLVFLFDWGALFLLRFRRFSTMPLEARKRYLRMWMTSRFALARSLVFVIRAVVLGAAYDRPAKNAGR